MHALTVSVALAAAAATVAEALPWVDRHPLAVLLMVSGLIYLVGRQWTRRRRAPAKVESFLGIGCDGHGDDCDGGNGGNGDGGC